MLVVILWRKCCVTRLSGAPTDTVCQVGAPQTYRGLLLRDLAVIDEHHVLDGVLTSSLSRVDV
jgi:hypothetical protein